MPIPCSGCGYENRLAAVVCGSCGAGLDGRGDVPVVRLGQPTGPAVLQRVRPVAGGWPGRRGATGAAASRRGLAAAAVEGRPTRGLPAERGSLCGVGRVPGARGLRQDGRARVVPGRPCRRRDRGSRRGIEHTRGPAGRPLVRGSGRAADRLRLLAGGVGLRLRRGHGLPPDSVLPAWTRGRGDVLRLLPGDVRRSRRPPGRHAPGGQPLAYRLLEAGAARGRPRATSACRQLPAPDGAEIGGPAAKLRVGRRRLRSGGLHAQRVLRLRHRRGPVVGARAVVRRARRVRRAGQMRRLSGGGADRRGAVRVVPWLHTRTKPRGASAPSACRARPSTSSSRG